MTSTFCSNYIQFFMPEINSFTKNNKDTSDETNLEEFKFFLIISLKQLSEQQPLFFDNLNHFQTRKINKIHLFMIVK